MTHNLSEEWRVEIAEQAEAIRAAILEVWGLKSNDHSRRIELEVRISKSALLIGAKMEALKKVAGYDAVDRKNAEGGA